jgi:tetratricopeptide (TPR) repeat protein
MAAFDSLSQDALIARVRQALQLQGTQQPAFTLLLGSGFSAPLIPTAGQVVARDVAWWLYCRLKAGQTGAFADRPAEDGPVCDFEKELWPQVQKECGEDSFSLKDGLPEASGENVGKAYQAIMSGRATSGLSNPQYRRQYLLDLCARIGNRVNGAHIFLASILRAQDSWSDHLPWRRPFCDTLFTTNFDPLLQRSLQLVSRLYFMSDRPEALEPPENENQEAIHLVYSHGSVHRYLLLNTEEEIEKARARNAPSLVPYFQRHGVLVVGYSGWHDATMQALADCTWFSGNLYWCDVYRPEEAEERLSQAARKLLKSKRGNAFYVPIVGADDLMLALHRQLELGDAPGFIRDPIAQMIEDLKSVDVLGARKSTEPRAIDTLKDSCDRTVVRLRAAQRVFEEPEHVQAAGQGNISADDQKLYEEAVTAKILDQALAKSRKGAHDQAIRLWTIVIEDERSPVVSRARALVNRGVTHGQQGRPDPEIADYTAAIDMPGAPAEERARALVYRGLTHAQQDRPDQALADYSAVIAMPDAPAEQRAMAFVNRGVTLGEQGRPGQEIEDYAAVIAMSDAPAEERAQALLYRGMTHQQQGRPDQALADYSAVIAMPDAPAEERARALVCRGETRRQQGRRERAIKDYSDAIAMPDAPADQRAMALVNRGVTHGEQGRPEQEIADYTAVIAMPDAPPEQRAQALVYRGVTQEQLGRPEQEIADYSAVIAMPDAPAEERAQALLYRGMTHQQQGRPDQAIADFTAVVPMPDAPAEWRAQALVYRGMTHGQQGRPDQAIADYTAVIAMPNAPAEQRARALIKRGVTHGQQGRPDQAIADYTAVIAMPDAPADQKSRALAYRAWRRFTNKPSDLAGLREDSEAALAIAPRFTFARFSLGLALLLAGESGRASGEYARASKQEADAAKVRSAREDLERATADDRVPGGEEIFNLLRAREAELAAASES